MRKLNSEKASQNPLAESQLGAVPVKAGQGNHALAFRNRILETGSKGRPSSSDGNSDQTSQRTINLVRQNLLLNDAATLKSCSIFNLLTKVGVEHSCRVRQI